ncbi:MAG: hypothetical protein CMD14_09160 [Flavobacteriales bacterium]|nr:hypothetical protein [Flavobacteriales bacterium]|tara:strand:+ start:24661 stop:25209 length:549 start_codon:yes stop_codon:yes gene_type:complete
MKIIASLLLATMTLVSGFQQPLVENIGVTAPFNKKFDPLGFSENVPDIEVSRLRESELKHGRWAMISAASIPLLETHSSEPAIHAYDKLPHPTQFTIAALILMGEFMTMLRGYENPFTKGSPYAFKLRKDYQPGDLGLSIYNNEEKGFKMMADRELNNGRLAMIGALGMIVQELVTNKPLFH